MQEGAECVCVAQMNCFEVWMPVFLFTDTFTSSKNARGNMQLSTTTMANCVFPSSSTIARAVIREPTSLIDREVIPPLTNTGSSFGVASAK